MYPILFHIYGFEIHMYPVLIFLGIVFSAYYFSRLCFKNKLSLDLITDHFYIIVGLTFLSARCGGMLESFGLYFREPLRFFYIFDGVYNFYTGVLGFLLTLTILVLFKKENVWKWLDVVAQSGLIFFFFTSMADFFAGNNYGIPSILPWAVSFNIPEVRYTVPIHPVQIYEFILLLFIFFFIRFIKRKRQYDGVIASYAFLLFFLSQSILTFFRGTPDTLLYGIKLSLILSAFFSSIALVILVIRTHPNIHFIHHE